MEKQVGVIAVGASAAVFIVVALAFLMGRSESVDPQSSERTVKVAATIFPLADIVRTVGGEYVDVLLIIPPGVSEHSSELKPQQLADLEQAHILFQIGVGLDDPVVTRITQAVPTIRAVTVDRGIQLREFGDEEEYIEEEHAEGDEHVEEGHEHGSMDPHYWLTVPNALIIATTVADELAKVDPLHAAAYQENVQRYQQHLESLEKDLQSRASGFSRKEFIAVHDAWSYFAGHYGLRLVATYEPIEGKQPSLADLQHIQDVTKQYGITTFYTEPQKTTSAVTNLFTDEFGLEIGVLDPVGGIELQDSYVSLMRRNMEALAAGAH